MNTLIVTLIIIIWIFIGGFICHKRNWYRNLNDDKEMNIAFSFILSPIALLVAIFREMILDDWDN